MSDQPMLWFTSDRVYEEVKEAADAAQVDVVDWINQSIELRLMARREGQSIYLRGPTGGYQEVVFETRSKDTPTTPETPRRPARPRKPRDVVTDAPAPSLQPR